MCCVCEWGGGVYTAPKVENEYVAASVDIVPQITERIGNPGVAVEH